MQDLLEEFKEEETAEIWKWIGMARIVVAFYVFASVLNSVVLDPNFLQNSNIESGYQLGYFLGRIVIPLIVTIFLIRYTFFQCKFELNRNLELFNKRQGRLLSILGHMLLFAGALVGLISLENVSFRILLGLIAFIASAAVLSADFYLFFITKNGKKKPKR